MFCADPSGFILFPLVIHSFDLVVSACGILSIRSTRDPSTKSPIEDPMAILQKGYSITILLALFAFFGVRFNNFICCHQPFLFYQTSCLWNLNSVNVNMLFFFAELQMISTKYICNFSVSFFRLVINMFFFVVFGVFDTVYALASLYWSSSCSLVTLCTVWASRNHNSICFCLDISILYGLQIWTCTNIGTIKLYRTWH